MITKFFENGNTDSALRLALGHLKNVAVNSLYPRLSRYSPQFYGKNYTVILAKV